MYFIINTKLSVIGIVYIYLHTLYIKIYEINNIKRRRLRYLNILNYNILLYYTVVLSPYKFDI